MLLSLTLGSRSLDQDPLLGILKQNESGYSPLAEFLRATLNRDHQLLRSLLFAAAGGEEDCGTGVGCVGFAAAVDAGRADDIADVDRVKQALEAECSQDI